MRKESQIIAGDNDTMGSTYKGLQKGNGRKGVLLSDGWGQGGGFLRFCFPDDIAPMA